MSRTVKLLIILLILLILLLGLGVYFLSSNWHCIQIGGKAFLRNPLFKVVDSSVCYTYTSDDAALSDAESPDDDVTYDKEGKNIIVISPKKGNTVNYPIKLIGRARVFENQYNYRLTDSNGGVLAEGFGMTEALDVGLYGPFVREIFYKLPTTQTATLSVFQYSMQDGSEQDKVSVPVKFSDLNSQKVKVFFTNSNLDPMDTCQKVFAVTRDVPITQRLARAALEELIRGPFSIETGYQSFLPVGVMINKLTIENGVAKVDFNYALNQTGGSCVVGLIRLQIEETLKQFGSVKSVIISVDGKSEDILQP